MRASSRLRGVKKRQPPTPILEFHRITATNSGSLPASLEVLVRLLPFLLFPAAAFAAPMTLQHQGRLLDTNGAPVNGGSHTVLLELWNSETGTVVLTDRLHTESFSSIAPEAGYYAVELGSGTSLDSSVFGNAEVWMQVTLDGIALGDRQRLSSVPSAAHSHQTAGFAPNAATCASTGDYGSVRWTGSEFQGCNSSGWTSFAMQQLGLSGGQPAQGCLSLHQIDSALPDGIYWIDPTNSGAPFQVYCDMGTGGWTLVARMTVASGQDHYNAGAVGTSGVSAVQLNTLSAQKFSDVRINQIRTTSTHSGTTGYRMTCWEGETYAQTMFCSSACTFDAIASSSGTECSKCTPNFDGTLITLTPNPGTRGMGHHHATTATYPWAIAYQRHPEAGTNPGCRTDAYGSGDGRLWVR